ncbi:DUF222 domain-containing protein [Brachybacterium sp. UMB0905]|nr:DUF222 domain-containing protein [Brachybacterium sp. UMB0905]
MAAVRSGSEADCDEAQLMVRVQERRRLAGTLYAEEVRDLALLWTVDDDHPGEADELAVNCLIAAAGLRSKVGRAEGKLRDAVHATRDLPLCLDLVAGGVLPVEWFEWLIRSTRRLEPEQRRQVDDRVAEWDLAGIDVNRFYRELRMLIAWFGAGLQQEHPTQQRNVEVFTSPDMDGTACLQVTGPVPEITALGHRLDAAARAVQTTQRQALAEAGPASSLSPVSVPFDVFGTVAETGRPMSLAALRYAILTRTAFGTDGIEVPESGFRINVTVPVMTLLGQSEAPGEVDGTHPIPPAMARELVVNAPVFHRVLTDPVDGSFLPRAAKTYQVSRSMQELLRQIDPICAVPGCSTIVTTSGETDHIEEFDHAHPDRGGPTSPENLHRLCYSHHRLKTLGLIDPIRDPHTGVTTWTARTRGRSRPVTETTRNTDLVTRELGDHLRVVWNSYLEREEDAHRRARGEASGGEASGCGTGNDEGGSVTGEPGSDGASADPPSPAAPLYDPEHPPY